MSGGAAFNPSTDLVVRVEEASLRLKQEFQWDQIEKKPKVGIVLGSGLGAFADKLTNRRVIPYKKIPHMKESAVPGHAGQWVYGLGTKETPLLLAQGRVHFYEGYPLQTVTLGVRMMKALGVEHLILTNAAGSVNPDYKAGDFMLIDDHLNLLFESPLHGINEAKLGPRFVDMSEPYCRKTNQALLNRCKQAKPDLRAHRGVYAMLSGPQYETPAEIRMLYRLGADAVGMSTVSECIAAKQSGLTVHGISCITNLGSGLSQNKLHHDEVTEMGKRQAPLFCWLLEELIKLI